MSTNPRGGIIRCATADDAPAIAAIYRPAVESSAASFELTPPDAAEMTRRMAEISAQFPYLVYTESNAVLGYAYASPARARAAYRFCCEVSVYIHPAAQRRGIGRRLYAALFAILRAQRYLNIYGGITLPNPPSVALHEHFGFKQVALYPQIGYKFDRWHDVVWYWLRLDEPAAPPAEIRPLGEIDVPALLAEM